MGKTTLGKTVTTTNAGDDNGWRMWLTCILILLSFTCCIIKMNELAVHVRDGLRILGVLHSTHTTMIKNIHTGQLYHEQKIWEHTMNLTTMNITIHAINTNLSNVNTSMNNDWSIANNRIVELKQGRIADKEEIKQLTTNLSNVITENQALKHEINNIHTGQLCHEQKIWENTMNLTNMNTTMSNISINLSNVNTSMNNDLSIANNEIIALKERQISNKEEITQLRTENRALKLQLHEFQKDVAQNMTVLLNNLTTSIARLGEDECMTDNAGCAHICTDTFGPSNYVCSCHSGYILMADKHSCASTGSLKGEFTHNSGWFTSPNYPSNYPHGFDGTLIIQSPPNTKISVTFTAFILENVTPCRYDFVQLTSRSGVILSKICAKPTTPIITSDNYIKVLFRTDNNYEYTGFRAECTFIPV